MSNQNGKEMCMQTVYDLKEKIQSLETERKQLAKEIENLRKAAESRAATLENEVKQMEEEAETLREILEPSSK